MPRTPKQQLGDFGEQLVVKRPCPRCKRSRTLKRLPTNFKCADVICDFCGYLAQVKTTERPMVDQVPGSLLGAAWGPQFERMQAGVYFPLFVVVVTPDRRKKAIYYLPADLQSPANFEKRAPLSASARRAGWTGYHLRLNAPGTHPPVRLNHD